MYRNLRQNQASVNSCNAWTVYSKVDVCSDSYLFHNFEKVLCYTKPWLYFRIAKTTIKFSRHAIFSQESWNSYTLQRMSLSSQVLLHPFTPSQSLAQKLYISRNNFFLPLWSNVLGIRGFFSNASMSVHIYACTCACIRTCILSKRGKNSGTKVIHSNWGDLDAILILV